MNKFFGAIGYAETQETEPGVWEEVIVERNYYGDIRRWARRLVSSSEINDSIDVNNELSIIADPYAYSNFSNIRYVVWMDNKWKVSNVTVEYPRLTLGIGGLYNG